MKWAHSTPAGIVSHEVVWNANRYADTVESARSLAQRYWCHLLIASLPDGALHDVLPQLASTYESYALALSWQEGAEISVVKRQKAKVVRRFERPVFPIED